MLLTEDQADGYISWLIQEGGLRVSIEDGERFLYPDMDRLQEIAPAAYELFYDALFSDVAQMIQAGEIEASYDDQTNDFGYELTEKGKQLAESARDD